MVSAESGADLACQGCGRTTLRAKKVHKGQRYCDNCYRKRFKRRMCAGCGNFARLPVFDLSAHCSSCEQSAPCVRCEKTEFKTGMRTEHGPVCKVCVPYFREPERCENCGILSQRIATSAVTGLRSCQKCREPAQATCSKCRRHRVLVAGDAGQMLCQLCHTEGERKCSSCGMQMPAGRVRECEPCSWAALYKKRVQINLNGFGHQLSTVYKGFAEWLLEQVGPHKAALNINKHYLFFKAIDEKWGAIPGYDALLTHFGALALRRAENPMRWLAESGKVAVDEMSRNRDSERRRIEATLAEIHESWPKQLLADYYAVLLARMDRQKTDLHSVRLALRAAANFLKVARLDDQMLPTTKHLEAYWRGSPGQIAALTGFVGFLNKNYQLELSTKPNRRWLMKAKTAKAEHELVALLQDRGADDFERRWIAKALVYFHSISRVSRNTLVYRHEPFQHTAGFSVSHGEGTLWVPSADSYRPRIDFGEA